MQFVVVCGCSNQGYKCTTDTRGYWAPFQDGMDQFLCYLVVVIGHIVSVSLRGHMRGSRPSACLPSTLPPKKIKDLGPDWRSRCGEWRVRSVSLFERTDWTSSTRHMRALAKALECLGNLLECFLLVRSLLLPVVVVATACSTVGAKILQKDVGRALLVRCLALPGSMGHSCVSWSCIGHTASFSSGAGALSCHIAPDMLCQAW